MALNLKTWMQNLHDGSYDNVANARKSAGINAAKGSWPTKDKDKAMAAIDDYFQSNGTKEPAVAKAFPKGKTKDKKARAKKKIFVETEFTGAGSSTLGHPVLYGSTLYGTRSAGPRILLLARIAEDMQSMGPFLSDPSELIDTYRRVLRSVESDLLKQAEEDNAFRTKCDPTAEANRFSPTKSVYEEPLGAGTTNGAHASPAE